MNRDAIERAKNEIAKQNPLYWSLIHGSIDGQRFCLDGHKYLEELYKDWHPYITIEKASQMGATIFGLNARVFYPCDIMPVTIIYMFPTDQDVSDFSRARVKPMITDNPYLANLIKKRDADTVGVRRIGYGVCYWRGTKSSIRTKSVPADILVFDEVDEMEPVKKAQALKRLSHSRINMVAELSTPSIPDYGIDVEYKNSDQRHWCLKCQHCGDWHILEDEFPNCLEYEFNAKDNVVTTARLICIGCKGTLDPQEGAWIAKYPHRTERRGYHMSQLFSSAVDLREIVKEYLSRKHVQIFYNHRLGLPYVDARGRVSIQEFMACVRDYQMNNITQGKNTFAGCDQGGILHIIIEEIDDVTRKPKTVWIGMLKEFSEIDNLMRRHEIKRLVIDALPNQHSARDLARRFPGRVFLSYYDKTKGDPVWNEDNLEVHSNRTETIDGMLDEIRYQDITFPQCQESEIIAQHVFALVKKEEEDEETGERTWTYIHTGEDHYAHALNYARLARAPWEKFKGGAVAQGSVRRDFYGI